MKSLSILIFAVAMALAAVSAMPQRRLKSQRQVEYSSTPYPPAGFRPRIPFALPGEQPKLEAEPLTTPSAVEALENAETTTEMEQQEAETETEAELEVFLRKPANTYAAPDDQQDTVEVVAQAPAREFQPPILEAVEDFDADGAVAGNGQQPVADVPALGQAQQNEPESIPTDVEVRAVTPAGTYGPPASAKPASTYGAPELSEPENELDPEESQVELVGEQEEEDELVNELASGRLILLPLGSRGAQFGRLILAVEQTRQRTRSERLRRI
ncbi:uncharacterized protein LOC117579717 [Drosophila guanche]|uniref:DUF4794 domain-containing protein n=1 Tax=Drosophila guanche TaxID=7266 RepID=A0A3B0JR61_DROGU|nr:uncharacterized protein LOC117579717 [Drosophila guanche]SPP76159.1 Hypothetical predicted protein [Drosophila guanche]